MPCMLFASILSFNSHITISESNLSRFNNQHFYSLLFSSSLVVNKNWLYIFSSESLVQKNDFFFLRQWKAKGNFLIPLNASFCTFNKHH